MSNYTWLEIYVSKDTEQILYKRVPKSEWGMRRELKNSVRLYTGEARWGYADELSRAAEDGCEYVGLHGHSNDYNACAFFSRNRRTESWDKGVDGGYVIYDFGIQHIDDCVEFDTTWKAKFKKLTGEIYAPESGI